MTQEEFVHIANEMRVKAVSVARQFGYALDDAEDGVRVACGMAKYDGTGSVAAVFQRADTICREKT